MEKISHCRDLDNEWTSLKQREAELDRQLEEAATLDLMISKEISVESSTCFVHHQPMVQLKVCIEWDLNVSIIQNGFVDSYFVKPSIETFVPVGNIMEPFRLIISCSHLHLKRILKVYDFDIIDFIEPGKTMEYPYSVETVIPREFHDWFHTPLRIDTTGIQVTDSRIACTCQATLEALKKAFEKRN